MNPDDIARILDELGQRLGPSGEYVFGLAVRQVYIDALSAVAYLVVAIVIGLVIRKRGGPWGIDQDDFLRFIGPFAYAIVLGLVTVNALWLVPKMLNPEYAALTSILSRIAP